MGLLSCPRQNEWRTPHGQITARESAANFHWGTMLNSESEQRKSADDNYNTNRSQPDSADLSVVLPDTPPTFDAPATKALLRLLLAVRDRRREAKNARHNGA
jgi:hypothetical protein